MYDVRRATCDVRFFTGNTTNGALGVQGEGAKTRKSGLPQGGVRRRMEGTKARAVWELMAAEDTSDALRLFARPL
jgi:hypothetical protein